MRRPARDNMATIEQKKALVMEQHTEPVATTRDELATLRTAVAEELRAELREFVKTEIQKSEERSAPKRKVAKGFRPNDGSDADMGDTGPRATSPRFYPTRARGARARPTRSASAPPSAQQDVAEHVVLWRLPEPVNESVARKWVDAVVAKARPDFAPTRTVFLPFQGYVTAHFDSAAEATAAAPLPRKLKLRYATRAGSSMARSDPAALWAAPVLQMRDGADPHGGGDSPPDPQRPRRAPQLCGELHDG